MPRLIWERKIALKGWNRNFTWIRSGSQSIATDRPYEIYEKRFSPNILAVGAVNDELLEDISTDLRDVLSNKKFQNSHFIQGALTAVVGNSLTTRRKARRAYTLKTARTATVHTGRKRIQDLERFFDNVLAQLDHLAELPSKPSWLVAFNVTIYFGKEDGALVKKSGTVRMTNGVSTPKTPVRKRKT
jgi:hypothetical protein